MKSSVATNYRSQLVTLYSQQLVVHTKKGNFQPHFLARANDEEDEEKVYSVAHRICRVKCHEHVNDLIIKEMRCFRLFSPLYLA